MGSEFGQSEEWNYDRSLQWHLNEYKDHNGIAALVKDLNHLYKTDPALSTTDFDPNSFRWIACWDAGSSIISYLRTSADGRSKLLVIGHFTPCERPAYRMGLPAPGYWREVMNTNSGFYGGTNTGNGNGLVSEPIEFDGCEQSAEILLPPCSTLIFKHEG
jgi:1,4-alpha-glucan branching enzyme